MTYLAYLCWKFDDEQPTIEFSEPHRFTSYIRIIPIHFSVLMSWTDKDISLFSKV